MGERGIEDCHWLLSKEYGHLLCYAPDILLGQECCKMASGIVRAAKTNKPSTKKGHFLAGPWES